MHITLHIHFFVQPLCPFWKFFECKQATFHIAVLTGHINWYSFVPLKGGSHFTSSSSNAAKRYAESICSEFWPERIEKDVIKVIGHSMAMSHQQNMTIKKTQDIFSREREAFSSLYIVLVKFLLYSLLIIYIAEKHATRMFRGMGSQV